MDYGTRGGSRPGAGAPMSEQQAGLARKERLRKLAMETIDLSKDPYFMRNHLGMYECKLCLTIHRTEGNYLSHTQGRRHQQMLGRRAAKSAQTLANGETKLKKMVQVKKSLKIGRPGYKILKKYEPVTKQKGLEFELSYPNIDEGIQPRHRFMSAYEQKIGPQTSDFQYLLFAAEPYETVGFRIPNEPLDKSEGSFRTNWDKEQKLFKLSLMYKVPEEA